MKVNLSRLNNFSHFPKAVPFLAVTSERQRARKFMRLVASFMLLKNFFAVYKHIIMSSFQSCSGLAVSSWLLRGPALPKPPVCNHHLAIGQ